MERNINNMMRDLQFLMKHGRVDMDLTDFRYVEMLCGAVEAIGKKYAFYVKEDDAATVVLKLV
ncbi:hypothetical protein [Bacillus sp. LK2]|uniref:hypothetical protein n=1 Tax=Bacillus sp. LK2 TaxID=1628206 RepID=UPI000652A24A|nr:hypothetical protein [Bacillus sp. LK2]KMN42482.1 hypothetical protein VK90_24050 [Bacillus sp. LK2]